jgi:hypothetical protein
MLNFVIQNGAVASAGGIFIGIMSYFTGPENSPTVRQDGKPKARGDSKETLVKPEAPLEKKLK